MGKKKSDHRLRYLSFREWKRLKRQDMPIRDSLIFQILYETGCTVKELSMIRVKDLELSFSRIRLCGYRGSPARYSYISDHLVKILRVQTAKSKPDSYLLSSRQSPCMTTKRIRQLVQSYSLNRGIPDVNPQIIRYTHIVHAYLKDVPLNEIQKQVGLRRSRAIELFSTLPEKPMKKAYRSFLDE